MEMISYADFFFLFSLNSKCLFMTYLLQYYINKEMISFYHFKPSKFKNFLNIFNNNYT